MGQKEEILVPLRFRRDHIPRVLSVRSTLLSASALVIRERGLEKKYFELLPPKFLAEIHAMVAGTWVPIELATAHYNVIDQLGFTAGEAFEIGRAVSQRIQHTALGTMVRLAQSAGVTPWSCVMHYQRMWDRVWQGGDCCVWKIGPKEARLDGFGLPVTRFSYLRNAWRGMIASAGELFCRKMYVTEVSSNETDSQFRAAWV